MTDRNSEVQQLIRNQISQGEVAGWEAFYAEAGGDPGAVPWAQKGPRRELVAWAFEKQPAGRGHPALVIGCGLGDDAEFLAGLGYTVTAFDVSETAVAWCKRRFPHSQVTYQVADLFAPPANWRQAFDLVLEDYVVQALPPALRKQTVQSVASLVAPAGTLLAIGLGLMDACARSGPPWPLTPAELALFEEQNLTLVQLDRRDDPESVLRFRYWAEYRKARATNG